MSESQIGEEKDGKEGMDVFPVDETPTPTRILKLANDLFPDFQDPKENPFDMHFRKAAEAAQSGKTLSCLLLVGQYSSSNGEYLSNSILQRYMWNFNQ